MPLPEPVARAQREQMVAQQIEGRGIRDPAVLAAMLAVPREVFVAEKYQEYAYDDAPLPLPEGQTISQPYVVALMAASLKLRPGDQVLEIGTGSGYAAAVLSRIAAAVYTVERHDSLATYAREKLALLGYNNVSVLCGDGTLGWPEYAPYDGIVVAAGGPRVPHALREQLVIGGRLVMPVGSRPRLQQLVRLTREGEQMYRKEALSRVRFVPLIGAQGWEGEQDDWDEVEGE
ncbi:MAG: protein-L-isoaspartate(D-aspartate) O-methyltransferase [Chloroflexi bacterium]|nr:protein-L-isoaspartate(D-aspartate) O-methyltransferase [Chloroflexota bacterium]MCI0579698.1 protein-L-isoaspartate(D-aspartate) O-methyltransferase [Chloroflexota bacterium]MCI0650051.1 protein-L-isoaspartate(D-aspartate) O-methyltransferase [Chloroflexota bacterium]MCI0727012.1 protein-L-isoaspartate(D-aspartate) O-methyltransferase [Chloroflexota bacterium]